MNEQSAVIAENKGEILFVTLNRARQKNALHPPASRELASIFKEFEQDATLRVAIITGAGGQVFCAGNDVRYAATASPEEQRLSEEGFAGLTHYFDRKKPIIAAVNGLALGGGFEIALAADIVVAGRHASFALPEPKIGIAALGGGIHRLVRQIPYKKAVEMLITGDSVSAEEGRQLGFVNQVVEPGHELEASIVIAEKIIACAPLAIEISLLGAREVHSTKCLQEVMAGDMQSLKRLFKSKDAYEGMKAFSEKRKPEWSGR